MQYTIPLGDAKRLTQLFSFPNNLLDNSLSLAETISHWLDLTLHRDGFDLSKIKSSIEQEAEEYYWYLEGSADLKDYAHRLPLFLTHGWQALQTIEQLKTAKPDTPWPPELTIPTEDKLWDPQNTGQWRFFMPLGMAMRNQVSLQFFHYPPIRLLDGTQDYLADPVPVRWAELLTANGVTDAQNPLFNTVVDGAPIAAPDDQGTQYIEVDGKQQSVHLIPIQHFHEYQRSMVQLLLNQSSDARFTVPMVVYGTPARETFSEIWGKIYSNQAKRFEIIQGKQTPVVAVGHPYRFYAACQPTVGCGYIPEENIPEAIKIMQGDLAVARWQKMMAENPAQDPQAMLVDCQQFWQAPAQQETVNALVAHQGSLYYPTPNDPDPQKALHFEFKQPLNL